MANRFGSLPSGQHYDASLRAPENEAREIEARRARVQQTAARHNGRHVRIDRAAFDPTVAPKDAEAAR